MLLAAESRLSHFKILRIKKSFSKGISIQQSTFVIVHLPVIQAIDKQFPDYDPTGDLFRYIYYSAPGQKKMEEIGQ